MLKNKRENNCYTYFSITGDFDPDVVSQMLELLPFDSWKKGDMGEYGKKHLISGWEFGKCVKYDFLTANQIKQTISPLISKIDVLKKIKQEYDVEFSLNIVPEIYLNNSTPALAPDLDVIDFCHETRTKIDIDLYINK